VKVALLSFNFGPYCVRLANGLARHAEVLLVMPRNISEPFRFGLDPAVELFQLDSPRLRQPARQLRATGSAIRRIRAFEPDVIHYQAGHLWFNFAWPALRRFPLVVSIHESRHHLGDDDSATTPQWIMDLGYRRADRVIVHGEQLRGAVVADLGLPRDIIDVVPPVPDIVLSEADVANVVEEDPHLILFYGRIWPYKGLDYLIRAEPLISARVPEARIKIAGSGEDFERYRRLMANPEHFILRIERIPDEEIPGMIGAAAVVVLPYIDGSVSGVVPIAYTFGKPVIATSVGILPEMVEHGRTGLVVPPRDEQALAAAVVDLLTDAGRRHALGENARRMVATVFDPETTAAASIETYERAIRSRR